MSQAGRAKGTVALVAYSPQPVILQNPCAQRIRDLIWQEHVRAVFREDVTKPARTVHQHGFRRLNAELGFAPLDPLVWEYG